MITLSPYFVSNCLINAAAFTIYLSERLMRRRMDYNNFYINYLTRSFTGIMNSQTAGKQIKGFKSFKDYVESGVKTDTTSARTAEDMTLEEYKQYIYNKISRIPLHPSQILRTVQVHITDEGFQAMQKDEEYEKWVLDTLRSNFSYNDPWSDICGGGFSIHRFGATKEEYRGDSWYTGFQGKESVLPDEEEGFWEKRAGRHKKYIELQQEMADKNKIMKRVRQEAALRRGDIEGMFDKDSITETFNLASLLMMTEDPEPKT